MISIQYTKSEGLGTFIDRRSDQGSRDATFHELTQITFYKLDPEKGVHHDSSIEIKTARMEEALKTHSTTHPLLLLIIPARTHTLKDVVLDVCCPFSRRFSRVALTYGCCIPILCLIAIDLLTLVIRLVTLIPRYLYQRYDVHPLKQPNTEYLYVHCKKAWGLEVTGESPTSTETKEKDNRHLFEKDELPKDTTWESLCTSDFYWRIDLVPALQSQPLQVKEGEGLAKDKYRRVHYDKLFETFFNDQNLRMYPSLPAPTLTVC